jgi:hypothetical protein
MRFKLFLIIIFCFLNGVTAQEIEINGLFVSSTTKQFKNSFGYGLGFNKTFNKNRFGVLCSYLCYKTYYDDIHSSTEDGVSKYIKEYEPNNSRFKIELNYSYRLIMNPKSNFYLGSCINLNYFNLKGEYERIENVYISGGHFSYDNSVNNRFGMGLLMEYELKEFIGDRISSSIRIQPEITSFDEFGAVGGYDPWLIGWLNFYVSFKYKLNEE